MANLDSKAGLLATIREERENVERLVTAAGDRIEEPGVTGDWTLKDIIGHLSGWRWRTVGRMEAAASGTESYTTLWPRELEENDDYQPVNDWLYERNRDLSAAEVLRESRETFDRLEVATAALPDDVLFTPGRFSWMEGKALGPGLIGGIVSHFHDEHEADLRRWLHQQH